jgi:hypothetical protein
MNIYEYWVYHSKKEVSSEDPVYQTPEFELAEQYARNISGVVIEMEYEYSISQLVSDFTRYKEEEDDDEPTQ